MRKRTISTECGSPTRQKQINWIRRKFSFLIGFVSFSRRICTFVLICVWCVCNNFFCLHSKWLRKCGTGSISPKRFGISLEQSGNYSINAHVCRIVDIVSRVKLSPEICTCDSIILANNSRWHLVRLFVKLSSYPTRLTWISTSMLFIICVVESGVDINAWKWVIQLRFGLTTNIQYRR